MGILDKLFGKRKIEKERSETRPEVKQVTEHGSDHDEISNRARNQSSAASGSSDKKKVNQECWTTHCRSCGVAVSIPRTAPPFGTTLVCPTCKSPVQSVYEDPPGCPVGWSPREVQVIFGYQKCSIEHPRCPWCGKIVYSVVFPERGREVPWYAVQQQENSMANYTIKVQCIHCARKFTVEWDGWPFSLDSEQRCNFCSIVGVGVSQFMTIPDDRRAKFETNLGRKASTLPYLTDKNGSPLWVACPICLKTALWNYDQEQGTDLAQVYSLGTELDPFVEELLKIEQKYGLIAEKKYSDAYNSEGRHKRGREIGEILCMKGGYKLMVRVAEAFVNRGGIEGHLSWCWHEIRDKEGKIVWLA